MKQESVSNVVVHSIPSTIGVPVVLIRMKDLSALSVVKDLWLIASVVIVVMFGTHHQDHIINVPSADVFMEHG